MASMMTGLEGFRFGVGAVARRPSMSAAAAQAAAASWAELEASLPEPAAETPKLTLYRDTNGWCPFCERVWIALKMKNIPFDEKVINLRDKPDWYKAIVPTTLVPAVELHDESYDPEVPGSGSLTWESADILKLLDEQFPDTPLLSRGTELETTMQTVAEEVLSSGFGFSFGARNKTMAEEEKLERRAKFEGALATLEEKLSAHGGPFMSGAEPGLVDCMIIPMLERYRYQLPLLVGGGALAIVPLYDAEARPQLTKWYDAMDGLDAYTRRCAGDAYSWTAVTSTFLRLFSADGADPAELAAADAAAEALLLETVGGGSSSKGSEEEEEKEEEDAEALMEAARKVISNREAIIGDCCRPKPQAQTQIERVPYTAEARAEVDAMLRRVAGAMIASATKQSSSSSSFSESASSAEFSASPTAAAAAKVIASRLCAPRDMGLPAATALRSRLMEVAMAG
jgi:glutathione S-transferase